MPHANLQQQTKNLIGFQLQHELVSRGIQCADIVRCNRLEGLPFPSDKEMKKRGGSSMVGYEGSIGVTNLQAIKWLDSRCVHLLYSFGGVQLMEQVNT